MKQQRIRLAAAVCVAGMFLIVEVAPSFATVTLYPAYPNEPVSKQFSVSNINAITWTGNWIWQAADGPANTWTCFRKNFNLSSLPASAIADIAVDSKYWMWINGNMAVFEGGLKRGPTPNDTYYDEIDIKNYLHAGTNTIAILIWYFGKQGFSHKDSRKGGLLFQSNIDGTIIASDSTWKMKIHPAYENTSGSDEPNFRLPESNVRFNAQNDIPGWMNSGYNDSSWTAAVQKGIPPCAPWNNLWLRPIPQWKNSELLNYAGISVSLPFKASAKTVIEAKLPYNIQITPYLDINSPANLTIDMRNDNYPVNGANTIRAEYVTKSGSQQYESLGWMNGRSILYTIPAGITVNALKYRETGYNTTYAGSFISNDSYFNTLWEKAKRTLYVCMRDNYMDCPDRERGQWWNDNTFAQAFYALDRNSDLLSKKAISNLIEWQRSDKTFFSPNPAGNWTYELPVIMLETVGQYGIWNYYWNTGDVATIANAYPHIRDYLTLWKFNSDGLVIHRAGGWPGQPDWVDWGSNIDSTLITNCMYYMALKAAKNMAILTGNTVDVPGYDSKMSSISNNFNRVLWQGTEYRSPGYSGFTDDRGHGLAVVAGLADSSKWPSIRTVLNNQKNGSPHMEEYVLEAQYIMGYENDALNRMKDRYSTMVNNSYSTLFENFPADGSHNHAWAGGPLTLLCKYGVGVAPETAGFGTYHILPQEGYLTGISAVVPSIKGNISVSINKNASQYNLNLVSPANTTAIVGIPKLPMLGIKIQSISVNNTVVWQNGYMGGVSGISWNGEDSKYYKFNVNPGIWNFSALATGGSTTTPTPTLIPTPPSGTTVTIPITVHK